VTGAGALLVATLAVPLGLLAACLSQAGRARMPKWLGWAPLPGLLAALLARDGAPVVLDSTRFQFTLHLDAPGAQLLGVAALLWIAAGAYASRYLAEDPKAARFAEWWLPTLAGSLGVFFAADLASFYITFAMLSLAAYGLVIHDDTPQARRSGAIYLGLAVLGEICMLLAFALLAAHAPGDSLLIRDVVAALPTSPWRDLTLALLFAGFGLKAGLVPLHVWLPLAHPVAPMPASAVLSGAIVKSGVIGWIRFLPYDVPLPEWGASLALVGIFTAFYAVAIGITQQNPKTVLAYSTVSQMGVIAAVLGMGLAAGDARAASAATFYAVHHLLAKGALFLAVGVAMASGAHHLRAVLVPAALLALGLGGLPLSGGALAKLSVKDPLGTGLVGTLAAWSAAGTTLLMLHFVRRLSSVAAPEPSDRAPAGLAVPWWAMAVASVALPWLLYVRIPVGPLSEIFDPANLWAAAWPVGLGTLGTVLLARSGARLPRVPEGDVVVFLAGAARASEALAAKLERADAWLREWPVAGVVLLILAILFAASMGVGS